MLQKERQSIGTDTKTKPSFSSTFSRFSRTLVTIGIITTLTLETVAPVLYAASKAHKKVKQEQTIAQITQVARDGGNDNYSRTVSSEAYVTDKGNFYLLKIEAEEGKDYIKCYYDGKFAGNIDISKFNDRFSGKFICKEITMGNPSFMIKGIDRDRNYGYLLYDWTNDRITPILSGFRKDILDKLGVEVKCIFEEHDKDYNGIVTWRVSFQQDGKEIGFVIHSEDGKIIKKDLKLVALLYLVAEKKYGKE